MTEGTYGEEDRLAVIRDCLTRLHRWRIEAEIGSLRAGIPSSTEEEKQAIMKENEKLYQGMKLYCMKYTIFAGMDIEKMYLDFSISPTKWNYWARDVIKFPFKNILKE